MFQESLYIVILHYLGLQIASGGVISNTPLLLAVYYYNIVPREEMYWILHPNWLCNIDSVKFNTFLSRKMHILCKFWLLLVFSMNASERFLHRKGLLLKG